jgi:hypothetical protein
VTFLAYLPPLKTKNQPQSHTKAPDMETLVTVLIGVSLSAAAGLRLLIPFFALSIAAIFGHFPLADKLQWLDTTNALEGLGIAVVIETVIYYIPWLDHLLDAIALPTAMVAGILITAAFSSDLDLHPFWQWSLAIIAGGGTAGAFKGLSGLTRIASTATTGGLANFIVTTLELLGALALSTLAIAVPTLAVVCVAILLTLLVIRLVWRRRQHDPTNTQINAEFSSNPNLTD